MPAENAKVMIFEAIKPELERAKIHEISIGYSTVHLFKPDKLEEGQIGYSVDPKGKSLAGTAEGDWRPTWVVTGYEESLGDPIFVDIAQQDFPVYTAMIGMGKWSGEKIADSFHGFIKGLEIISEIAVGRETPVLFVQNPISDEDIRQTITRIEKENPTSNLEFWESLLGND
jgi:hypothetical protein